MSTQQRQRHDRTQRLGGGGDVPASGAGNSEAIERARNLAEAADRAIQEVLSPNSMTFLTQNRQEGGQ